MTRKLSETKYIMKGMAVGNVRSSFFSESLASCREDRCDDNTNKEENRQEGLFAGYHNLVGFPCLHSAQLVL